MTDHLVAHRLGAIELIELGRGRFQSLSLPRMTRPYLAGPNRLGSAPRRPARRGPAYRPPMISNARLGILDFLGDIGSFLTGAFEFLFKTLADIVNVPLDLASQGIGVLFDGLAGLLANVPILGPLASGVLMLAKSIIQWGLSVPGLLLEGIGNIFGEIKSAIDATKTPEEKKKDEADAKKDIVEKAEAKGGEDFAGAVKDVLDGKAPDNTTGLPPGTTPGDDPPNPGPPGGEQVGTTPMGNGGIFGDASTEEVLAVGLPVAGAAALLFAVVS